MKQTLYDTLGVKKTDTKDKIKKSYRSKSKLHHPDTGGDPKKFQLITQAYKILTDDEKKARYDSGESVDDIMQSAANKLNKPQEILMHMFCGLVANIDPAQTDLIKLMKNNLQNGISDILIAIQNEKSKIEKFNSVLKRLKSKNNLFKELALSQINAITGNIKQFESKKEDLMGALDMLKDFSYKIDKEPEININQFNPFSGFYIHTTTG